MQNDLSQVEKPNVVYRTYLRYINNALEMSRAKYKIYDMSEHDLMTGLLNRRGMEVQVAAIEENALAEDKWMTFVIDMDGLKYMNDTFGHAEGDKGITTIASALKTIQKNNEICVRAGGDEFYLIGLGSYDNHSAESRIAEFYASLEEQNKGREIKTSASIGYAILDQSAQKGYISALEQADVQMYLAKRERKAGRL